MFTVPGLLGPGLVVLVASWHVSTDFSVLEYTITMPFFGPHDGDGLSHQTGPKTCLNAPLSRAVSRSRLHVRMS